MSIGPGSIGGFQIAGSIAGTQSNSANADRIKAEQAARKAQIDQHQFAAGEQEEQDPDVSADRDPDGRLPYSPGHNPGGELAGEQTSEQDNLPGDPLDERGKCLDLEA